MNLFSIAPDVRHSLVICIIAVIAADAVLSAQSLQGELRTPHSLKTVKDSHGIVRRLQSLFQSSQPYHNSNNFRYRNEDGESRQNMSIIVPDSQAYSMVFNGRYELYMDTESNNFKTTNTSQPKSQILSSSLDKKRERFSEGTIFSVILTRPSSLLAFRMVSIQLTMEDAKTGERRTIWLSGLEHPTLKSVELQGYAFSSQLFLPFNKLFPDQALTNSLNTTSAELDVSDYFPTANRCNLAGFLSFATNPETSKSARKINSQNLYNSLSEWGFSDAEFFIGGGSWRDLGAVDEVKHHSHISSETSTSGNNSSAHILPYNRSTSLGSISRLLSPNTSLSNSEPHHAPSPKSTVDLSAKHPQPQTKHNARAEEYVSGFIVSRNCGVHMLIRFTEVDLYKLVWQVIAFTLFFLLKCFFESHFFWVQMRYSESVPASSSKVSFMSLGLHAAVDCFESVVLLKECIATRFMGSLFLVLAIIKMLFLSFVELRYMVIVLKAHFPESTNLQNLRKYFKLYAAGAGLLLIVTLKLMLVSPSSILLLYCFWLPQILIDIKDGNRRSLCPTYVIGMSVCRVLFPLYLWGYPYSIFNGEFYKRPPGAPNLSLCLLLIVFIGTHALLLVAQYVFGPRCFLPFSLFPDAYNYYRVTDKPEDLLKSIEDGGCFECVICMADISYVPKTLVVTPCNHYFHEKCLLEWVQVKLECPTCRSTLPPLV